jgi:hypothetical protein
MFNVSYQFSRMKYLDGKYNNENAGTINRIVKQYCRYETIYNIKQAEPIFNESSG